MASSNTTFIISKNSFPLQWGIWGKNLSFRSLKNIGLWHYYLPPPLPAHNNSVQAVGLGTKRTFRSCRQTDAKPLETQQQILHALAPAASCVQSRQFFASTLPEELFEFKNEDAIKRSEKLRDTCPCWVLSITTKHGPIQSHKTIPLSFDYSKRRINLDSLSVLSVSMCKGMNLKVVLSFLNFGERSGRSWHLRRIQLCTHFRQQPRQAPTCYTERRKKKRSKENGIFRRPSWWWWGGLQFIPNETGLSVGLFEKSFYRLTLESGAGLSTLSFLT